MKKRILQTVLLLLIIGNAYGQDHVTSQEVNFQEKTPPSPNAASLLKYLDFPVNMATGVPNISIPLYTIKSGNINIPIVLSYHGGGVKVNDKAGWVGLGWTLEPGGSITKKTNGLDDIYLTAGTANTTPYFDYLHPDYSLIPYNPGYTNMTDAVEGFMIAGVDLPLDSNLRFMGRIILGQNDGEADDFFYNTPSASGRFNFNQKLSKFQNSKINGYQISGDTTNWWLRGNDGLHYQFGQREHTVNPLYEKGLSLQHDLITGWRMTVVEDVVNNKAAFFDYDNYSSGAEWDGYSQTSDYVIMAPYVLHQTNYSENKRAGDNYVLGRIRTSDETINFIKDTAARQDGNGAKALKEIEVYNRDSLLIKKIKFSYYYTTVDTGWGQQRGANVEKRLILRSVQEVNYDESGGSHEVPPYYFNYDTTVKLPARLSYAQDKWGYYNGKLANPNPLPYSAYFMYSSVPLADRNPDSNYVKAGVLNEVVYPTGGRANFEYAINRGDNSNLKGGLRIKQITYYDSVAQSTKITEYNYPASILCVDPVYEYQLQKLSGLNIYNNLMHFTYTPLLRVESEPIAPVFLNQGAPGYYPVVEKIEKSEQGDLLSRHYFDKIMEPMEFYVNNISVPHPKTEEIAEIPEIKSEIYKKEANGSYTLIQKDSTGYGMIQNTNEYIWNAKAAWCLEQQTFCEWASGDPYISTLGFMIFNISPSLQAYKINPSQVIKGYHGTSTYTANGTLSQHNWEGYDNNNGNLKGLLSVDSKGDTTTKIFRYACELETTGAVSGNNQEIDLLKSYNVLNAPVEIITLFKKKDSTYSTVIDATLYEYENLKPKKIYKVYGPILYSSFVEAYNNSTDFYKDTHYELYQEITSFDTEKNPQTVITRGNKEAYIWDGEDMLAQAVNAAIEDIACTSFESTQKGGWTYSGATTLHPTAPTGHKGYSLAGGSITKSGLTSGNTYTATYWKRDTSSTVTVSTGTSTEIAAKNGWKLYSLDITGVSSFTVSGTAYIDELRIYPKAAQMKSFAYTPFVGVITECDGASHIMYYEYESAGQLKHIKDADGKILKRVDYKYKGATTD